MNDKLIKARTASVSYHFGKNVDKEKAFLNARTASAVYHFGKTSK